jgi:ABC-type multidrug transport system ATPase subunit
MVAVNSILSGQLSPRGHHDAQAAACKLLCVEGLTKRYGRESAVADVTFSLSAGEVVGIVGPNGAGKTTLLETLAGLLAAESGTSSGAERSCRQREGRRRLSICLMA